MKLKQSIATTLMLMVCLGLNVVWSQAQQPTSAANKTTASGDQPGRPAKPEDKTASAWQIRSSP